MLLVVDSAAEIEKRWSVVQIGPENYASLLKTSNVLVASSPSLAEVEGGTEKRTTQPYRTILDFSTMYFSPVCTLNGDNKLSLSGGVN